MTELQKLYTETRVNQKCGHHAALRFMAIQTGLDEVTIGVALKRAGTVDDTDTRRGQ